MDFSFKRCEQTLATDFSQAWDCGGDSHIPGAKREAEFRTTVSAHSFSGYTCLDVSDPNSAGGAYGNPSLVAPAACCGVEC